MFEWYVRVVVMPALVVAALALGYLAHWLN
jgi:hypothetical protein